VLIVDIIVVLPPLGKYKYDTWRILPLKCYIDNSKRLRSCIRNINTGTLHLSDQYTNSRGWRDLVEYDNPGTGAPVLRAIEELTKSRTSTKLQDECEVY
jgi:hypothetical protein